VYSANLAYMWVVVTIFNPFDRCFLALAIVPKFILLNPIKMPYSPKNGRVSGGNWLSLLVGIDAALGLSGAVLTSFVGVGGLMERYGMDRKILPNFY